mgnify:CR=1 FL=1
MTSSRTGPRSRRYDHIAPFAPSASRSACWAKARSSGSASSASRTFRKRVVGGEAGGTQVAEVLVDPVRHQPAGDPLLPPVGRLHVAAPPSDVFQSSRTSWSSKIIETGTVEKSQRMTGSVHASR